jgi:transcriptional regulator of acetoin/glycerol metabolism
VSEEGIIRLSDLPDYLQHGTSDTCSGSAAPSLPQETERLRAALERHQWNITAVARELKVHRSTVYRQMQQFGICAEHH